MDNSNTASPNSNCAIQRSQTPQQQFFNQQLVAQNVRPVFNPLKSGFDIELHRLRRYLACYFRWGPNYERQGLILQIRNTVTAMLKEYIRYKKSKNKNRLYELDVLVEMLKVLWFDYFELGYLRKPLKSGKLESSAKAVVRYGAVIAQIKKLGAILGAHIKNLKQ